MSQHSVTLLVMLVVIAWVVSRRVRGLFGPQPVRRKAMTVRIVIFAVLGALLIWDDLRHPFLLEAFGGGLVLGVALGLLGLRLTTFAIDPVKGDCYVPHAGIGVLVTLLFVARLAWRLLPSLLNPHAPMPSNPYATQSPLSLVVYGLFVGYYICYYAGLLRHHQRIVRERPGTAA